MRRSSPPKCERSARLTATTTFFSAIPGTRQALRATDRALLELLGVLEAEILHRRHNAKYGLTMRVSRNSHGNAVLCPVIADSDFDDLRTGGPYVDDVIEDIVIGRFGVSVALNKQALLSQWAVVSLGSAAFKAPPDRPKRWSKSGASANNRLRVARYRCRRRLGVHGPVGHCQCQDANRQKPGFGHGYGAPSGDLVTRRPSSDPVDTKSGSITSAVRLGFPIEASCSGIANG